MSLRKSFSRIWKPAIWICTVSIALSMSVRLLKGTMPPKTNSSARLIEYLTVRGEDPRNVPTLSLAPAQSDQVDNQTILNALVATLVKFGSSGKIEPYLAASWSVSDDSKTWTFRLRPGFTCESGTPISAETFRAGLLESFRRNVDKSDHTEFGSLRGWKSFIQGRDGLEGLSADGDRLVFSFEKAPAGLLNFLRMPYFGFWCPDNFPGGAFRTDGGFSSSGPYRLDQVISGSRLRLRMRTDQPSYAPEAPQEIEIGYGVMADLSSSDRPRIGKMVIEDDTAKVPGFTAIDGPPLIFQGIALHVNSAFFKSERNRRVFARRLDDFKSRHPDLGFSKGFYLTSPLDRGPLGGFPTEYEAPRGKLRIGLQYAPGTAAGSELLRKMFAEVLNGLDFEIVPPDFKDPKWVKGLLNNPDFDIRTASVYGGAHHVVSVIKMMFCTNLGISFPDPSKRLCALVAEYEGRDADADFESRFNRILVEDAAVFPLFHARDRWLVSDHIDLETMPTSIIHPLFEKIRFK